MTSREKARPGTQHAPEVSRLRRFGQMLIVGFAALGAVLVFQCSLAGRHSSGPIAPGPGFWLFVVFIVGAAWVAAKPKKTPVFRRNVGTTPGVAPAVRTKTVKLGKMPTWVKTGERVTRTLKGYGWKKVDINAGKTRRVPTRSFVPRRAVTVVQSGDVTKVEALPGTTDVVNKDAFEKLLKTAAAHPATR